MDNDQTAKPEKRNQHPFPWRTLILTAAAVTIIALLFRACRQAGQDVHKVVAKAVDVAAKFKTGTITHTFVEYLPQIKSTQGDTLELATSHSVETFTRTDSKTIAWDLIPLGTTVSEITVPATFRYHIRLSDPWRLAARDNVCCVLAPRICPSLPTAIETDKMQKSTANGWGRFNKQENLEQLEKTITPELNRRAADPQHAKLVREECRRSVAEFVKKWLMKEDYWRTDRFHSIIVRFPDELNVSSDSELEQSRYEPTIKLN